MLKPGMFLFLFVIIVFYYFKYLIRSALINYEISNVIFLLSHLTPKGQTLAAKWTTNFSKVEAIKLNIHGTIVDEMQNGTYK